MPLDHLPKRIACLQPSATVILTAIHQQKRIVACTKYCAAVCPEITAGGKIILSDSWTADAGQIIAAQPDLVIGAVPYQEKAVAEILKSGARFLGLAPKTLADIYLDISVIAGMMGVSESGQSVIAAMQTEIAIMREKVKDSDRLRVFCEEWGKPLISSQPWVAELIEAAGGKPAGNPGVQISADAVRAEDPEVLIAAWCGAGDRVPLEKIVHERGWDDICAVQEGRVYCIRDEFLNTPAPTLIYGLHALAAAIHPERFPQAPGLRCIRDKNSNPIGATKSA